MQITDAKYACGWAMPCTYLWEDGVLDAMNFEVHSSASRTIALSHATNLAKARRCLIWFSQVKTLGLALNILTPDEGFAAMILALALGHR